MENLILASAVVECAAVVALLWYLRRTDRSREASLAAQRATLERLKADLAALLNDAEVRAHTLEAALGQREKRLGELLARIERAERAPAAESEPPRLRIDPAEARLLRDLERA